MAAQWRRARLSAPDVIDSLCWMSSTKKNFDRFLVLFVLVGIVVTYYFINKAPRSVLGIGRDQAARARSSSDLR